MNELETQNLHEYLIHQSTAVLIIKGGTAWALLALMDYGFDRLPGLLQTTAVNTGYLISVQPTFHLILNILYGWLLLYIVLSWVFEYYILRQDAVLVRRGIIFSREDVYQIEDIKSIDIYQGFWGKILKTGTIKFYMYRMDKWVYLNSIDNPFAIAGLMHSLHPAPQNLRSLSKSFSRVKSLNRSKNL